MEPLTATRLATAGLLYSFVEDFAIATPTTSTCLRATRLSGGTISSNASRSNFPIRLSQSPNVQSGLNSPPLQS